MKDSLSQVFGQRLKQLRENKNYTQEEVGDWFNMGKSTVSQWENGRIPHATILDILASKLGVTIDYLLGRTDYLSAPQPKNKFNVANNIKKIRLSQENKDLKTCEKIAGLLSISLQEYLDIEEGKNINADLLSKLANIFNVPEFELLANTLNVNNSQSIDTLQQQIAQVENAEYIAVALEAKQKGISVEELEKIIKVIEQYQNKK
ncbi:MAG: helix-turn-helix domain protein [Firmicutes bacterium]|nr:helix-turn-helix domain protein [Bacillota bacterium]